MFGKLGTTGLAREALDFGNGHNELLSLGGDAVGLFKRYTGHEAHIDCERTLIERWQEAATQSTKHHEGNHKQGTGGRENGFLVCKCDIEQAQVGSFHLQHDS